MKTRVLTAIGLAVVFIPLFVIGGVVLNITLALLTVGAIYELDRMFLNESPSRFSDLCTEMTSGVLLYWLLISVFQGSLSPIWIVLWIVLIMIVASLLLVFIRSFNGDKLGHLFVTILYPVIGFAAISTIRSFGLYAIGFLFLITISTDIFAYFFGVRFGKHRLAEHISPKKSIEGSIAGIVFAVLFTVLYTVLSPLDSIGNIPLTMWNMIGIIILISVIGQIGDLVASKLKRTYKIKDFSNIFPGHGGILDRFDSVLFASMILLLMHELVGIV